MSKLSEYETALIRGWAFQYAINANRGRQPQRVEELIEDAKEIEVYLRGATTATVSSLSEVRNGKRK